MSALATRPRIQVALVLATVYVVFWIQFGSVRLDNFGGIDEWMVLSLASRGIAAVPHANRPLGLLFNLPMALFPAHLLEAAWLAHGHYLVGAGLLTSLLLLRLSPGRPEWALVAGVCAATWAPSDWLRLNGIYSSAYAGVSAATVLAVLALASSRSRPVRVVVAAAVAFLATRVHEGCLPVLLIAPLLLLILRIRLSRSALGIYYAIMAVAVACVLVPLAARREETMYQREILGVYLDAAGLAERLATQFRLHLGPLLWTGRGALGSRPLASALLVAAAALCLRPSARDEGLPAWRGVVAGLLAAAASYSAFLFGARMSGSAARTEMIAGPWIGLAVGSAVVLMARGIPERARLPVVALLGACLAANAAVRTSDLQQTWDRAGSHYASQARSLGGLLAIAPDLEPGTWLLFVGERRTWLGSFVFHYALELMYAGRVAGCVPEGRAELFLTCFQDGNGVHQQPWPMLRGPWRLASRTYAFDAVVVVRGDAEEGVRLETDWPRELPALPSGAAYAPRARIKPQGARPPARSLVDRLPAVAKP